MELKKVIILLLFIHFSLIGKTQKISDSFETCVVTYNEVDVKGIERQVCTFAWFNEIPVIPVYTYFDKDAGKKVSIKSKISPYKDEKAFESENFTIVPGKYGEIYEKCKNSGNTYLIYDLKQALNDYLGESFAFEVRDGNDTNYLIIQAYPFEMDFPFKFEDDVVNSTFKIVDLDKKCKE